MSTCWMHLKIVRLGIFHPFSESYIREKNEIQIEI
jgi:hypothetical protein